MSSSASAEARRRFVAIVTERSFSKGTEMKLASGRTSSFYFNMKPTMLHPEGAHLIGELVLERIGIRAVDMVGGLEMGAVPIATAVAAASHAKGRPLAGFFVRKQAKEHGTQKLIEGLGPGETMAGQRVIIVEDVTTTGGSSMKAVEAVRAQGGTVVAVVTLVDREEGANDTFAAAQVPFLPVLTLADFR